jgi:hypothetical protein
VAVLNAQAACDARFTNNVTKNNTAGPITYGTTVLDDGHVSTNYPGSVGIVGVQPTTISSNSKGPFPGFEQDQEY